MPQTCIGFLSTAFLAPPLASNLINTPIASKEEGKGSIWSSNRKLMGFEKCYEDSRYRDLLISRKN